MENEDLEAYFDSLSDNDDLIVIDECERIPKNVWEDIFPIITNE